MRGISFHQPCPSFAAPVFLIAIPCCEWTGCRGQSAFGSQKISSFYPLTDSTTSTTLMTVGPTIPGVPLREKWPGKGAVVAKADPGPGCRGPAHRSLLKHETGGMMDKERWVITNEVDEHLEGLRRWIELFDNNDSLVLSSGNKERILRFFVSLKDYFESQQEKQ